MIDKKLSSPFLNVIKQCNDKSIPMDEDCIECPCDITCCMLGREENANFLFINLLEGHQLYYDSLE